MKHISFVFFFFLGGLKKGKENIIGQRYMVNSQML
jgi:hypothetical protein